jgi:hypothetical protein
MDMPQLINVRHSLLIRIHPSREGPAGRTSVTIRVRISGVDRLVALIVPRPKKT